MAYRNIHHQTQAHIRLWTRPFPGPLRLSLEEWEVIENLQNGQSTGESGRASSPR